MQDEQNISVLILDDERFLLDMYQMIFEKHGFDVTTYRSADDALVALRDGFNPDVILFDITMPDGRSGYEFLETIQSEGLAKRSMKVALTNEGQDGEKARLAQLGADAHLLKAAYVPSQLATAVKELFEARKSPQHG